MSNFIKQWTNKEVEVLTRSFKRHSAYVFILKFILPLTALVLIGMLFLYPMLTNKGKKIVLVAQNSKVPTTSPVMEKPKFIGIDSRSQPYQISARRAVQVKLDYVTLEGVAGDMTLNSGNWVSVVSLKGNYNSATHQVNLIDDVNFFMVEPDGATYQATTKNAFIDMDAGIMKSDEPVQIKSDSTSLTAQSFVIEREKQKITFKGPVKLIINNK